MRTIRTKFVAVFSDPVVAPLKEAILVQVRQTWPFVRLPHEQFHFRHHAHFASHNCDPDFFENEADREQAINHASTLVRDLPEWSRKFPSVTFALVDIDYDPDWSSGGYVCSNGTMSLHRKCEEKPHAYDLLAHVKLTTEHCDPLSPRYFCSVSDLKNEALAELDVLREYLRLMKGLLGEEWKSYDNAAREHLHPDGLEELEYPYDYLDSVNRTVEEERRYHTTLAQELRRSAFVSSYSLFEQKLIGICKYLDLRKQDVPALAGKEFDQLSKYKKGIFRAKAYLKNVVPPSFFDTNQHWKEIEKEYRVIRNWIVHNGREIVQNSYTAELVQIVATRHDAKIDDGKFLELSKTMCDTCADKMKMLFCELAKLLPKV